MSRELWAITRCEHGALAGESEHKVCGLRYCTHDEAHSQTCPGGTRQPLDFDAIWTRYYEAGWRRFESGLTYNELREVVYGEKKEEE